MSALTRTATAKANPLDAKMRAEDTRLQTPITLAAPRIYVGELLQRLSAQSGVKLTMSSREPESGIQVTAFLDNMPLADALDAVWSLLSYRHAEYALTRVLEDGKYRYLLSPTPRTKELADTFHKQVWEAFQQEATTMLAAAKMSPQERKKTATKNPRLAADLNTEIFMQGLSAFADSLSSQQQQQVLHGQQTVRVPFAQLPPQVQAFVTEETKGTVTANNRANGDGTFTVETKSLPDWLEFSTSAASHRVYPSLWVNFGGITLNYLGLEDKERDMLALLALQWLVPGDSATEAREAQQTGKQTEIDPKYLTLNNVPEGLSEERRVLEYYQKQTTEQRRLETRLQQFAQAAHISLLARLPLLGWHRYGMTFPAPYKQTIKTYLKQLREQSSVQHKWREGVLLLSVMDWFQFTDSYAPYAHVQALRSAATANNGYLPLSALAQAADTLTAPQLMYLHDEFPTIGVIPMQAVFALANRHHEMLTSSGYIIGEDKEARAALLDAAKASRDTTLYQNLQQKLPYALRLQDEPFTNLSFNPFHARMVSLQALDQEKHVQTLVGLTSVPWEPEPKPTETRPVPTPHCSY